MRTRIPEYRLVLDPDWRAELVRYRDRNRCTADIVHVSGAVQRCMRDATAVAYLGTEPDPRDLAAWAATCDRHVDEDTHRYRGPVPFSRDAR